MKMGHFLQSEVWEQYEHTDGHETLRVSDADFEAMLVVYETMMGKYWFCPYGPTVKDRAGFEHATAVLRQKAKEAGVVFLRVEPTLALGHDITVDDMKKLGYVKSHDLDPAHTWVIDLTKPKEQILKAMERRRARMWQNLEKKGVSIRVTKDPVEVKILVKFLQKLGEMRHFAPQSEEHLRRQLEMGFATLYIAEYEGKPIAAALFHDYGQTRFAMHAADDEEYRSFRAGSSLSIQAMMDAKDDGKSEFDFWGMTPSEDPKHPWYGFTQYKKSFGGRQVDYAGTWDLPIEKTKYRMYKVLRGVNRRLRKI